MMGHLFTHLSQIRLCSAMHFVFSWVEVEEVCIFPQVQSNVNSSLSIFVLSICIPLLSTSHRLSLQILQLLIIRITHLSHWNSQYHASLFLSLLVLSSIVRFLSQAFPAQLCKISSHPPNPWFSQRHTASTAFSKLQCFFSIFKSLSFKAWEAHLVL